MPIKNHSIQVHQQPSSPLFEKLSSFQQLLPGPSRGELKDNRIKHRLRLHFRRRAAIGTAAVDQRTSKAPIGQERWSFRSVEKVEGKGEVSFESRFNGGSVDQ